MQGRYRDGQWYDGVIAHVREDRMYVLDWDDGDAEDRVKKGSEVRVGRREAGQEGSKGLKRSKMTLQGAGSRGGEDGSSQQQEAGRRKREATAGVMDGGLGAAGEEPKWRPEYAGVCAVCKGALTMSSEEPLVDKVLCDSCAGLEGHLC